MTLSTADRAPPLIFFFTIAVKGLSMLTHVEDCLLYQTVVLALIGSAQ